MNCLYKQIYKVIRNYRMRFLKSTLKYFEFDSILDIGCEDNKLYKEFINKDYLGVDINPNKINHRILKNDIIKFKTNKVYDLVLALEIIEHTKDPIAVLNKIIKLSKKYIIISIPYEPYFTLFRFFVQEKAHNFIIYPHFLKEFMEKNNFKLITEQHILLRHYFGMWEKVE